MVFVKLICISLLTVIEAVGLYSLIKLFGSFSFRPTGL